MPHCANFFEGKNIKRKKNNRLKGKKQIYSKGSVGK